MDLRDSIQAVEKFYTKRKDLEGSLNQVPLKVVYFGGASEKLSLEKSKISEDIRRGNVKRLVTDLDDSGYIILPVFMMDDSFGSGIFYQQAEILAGMSDAYIEIVGDGFGDTSKLLAETAYNKAKSLGIPTMILTKTKRECNNPHYARDFLKEVDQSQIIKYKDSNFASIEVFKFLFDLFDEE